MRGVILAGLLLVGGCSGFNQAVAPKSPDQALFDVQSAYNAAELVVTEYGALPRCPAQPACHDPKVLVAAQVTRNKARDQISLALGLVVAWKLIKSPTASDTDKVMAAIVAAQVLVTKLNTVKGTS